VRVVDRTIRLLEKFRVGKVIAIRRRDAATRPTELRRRLPAVPGPRAAWLTSFELRPKTVPLRRLG
jgi:hypothetical protein